MAVRQPVSGIGEAEGETEQDEGQRVLAVLAEMGVRPQARRSERGEGDGGGQQPGDDPKMVVIAAGIARFASRRFAVTRTCDAV